MKYDVNFVLLGLLLVVIVAMIAMVFYYNFTYGLLHQRFESAMRDVENKTVELNKTVQEVNSKDVLLREREQLLLDYIQNLNLSKERETSLGSHFTEVKGKNELLEEMLNQTRNERNSYASLYTKTKTDYDVCQVNYNVKASELSSANGKILNMKGWLVEVSEKAGQINSYAENIEGMAGGIETTANNIKANKDNPSVVSELSSDARADASDIKTEATSINTNIDRIISIVNQLRSM